ncbi:MAG TPA: PilZ domain-containing protein [Candidatus Acidoferrum sp.]|nr:PilZ domain-containing protein [Candidatus Acidoferrum sp.]
MSGNERRSSPRKECAVPVRFRVVPNGHSAQTDALAADLGAPSIKPSVYAATCEGEAFNLSERGVYFRSRERVNVGERLEMYFTLPRELTGRAPEQVRCSARVVHVEDQADQRGTTGIGAFVERFEPLMEPRGWAN